MVDLIVDKLTKEYPTRAEPLLVLRGISLKLSAGENLAILGPSGCGKSTLLHILGTLDSPTSGSVTLGGKNLSSSTSRDLLSFAASKSVLFFRTIICYRNVRCWRTC